MHRLFEMSTIIHITGPYRKQLESGEARQYRKQFKLFPIRPCNVHDDRHFKLILRIRDGRYGNFQKRYGI